MSSCGYTDVATLPLLFVRADVNGPVSVFRVSCPVEVRPFKRQTIVTSLPRDCGVCVGAWCILITERYRTRCLFSLTCVIVADFAIVTQPFVCRGACVGDLCGPRE